MATETLLPNADTVQIWNIYGEATAWEATVSDDDDTSYIHKASNIPIQNLMHHDNTGLSGGISINSVTVRAKCKVITGPGYVQIGLYINRHTYQSGQLSLTTSYTWKEYEFLNNPDTGNPWQVSELDALVSSIYNHDNLKEHRCTRMEIVVDYDAVADTETGMLDPYLAYKMRGGLQDNA